MTSFPEVSDLPDTWSYGSLPDRLPTPSGAHRCGDPENDCPRCDGSTDERRELLRMPRRDRVALELANRRLDPQWRALHGLDDEQGGAA